jgi:Lar family restriction alleviation protein
MITVKACPFCGHEDVEIDELSPSEFAGCCPECRAIGPILDTVMEAIRHWNDRKP